MPSGPGKTNRVAIAGASSLRGKELKQVLEDSNFPTSDIVLLDESMMAGTLTEAGGEPTFIRALEEDSFEGARFAFFAGSPTDTARNWKAAQRSGATVIDLTGGLASVETTVAWIPSLDGLLPPRHISLGDGSSQARAYASPSTPVIIACTIAAALEKFHPQQCALVMFPPISERNEAGIEELESQTAGLLSFRPIAQPVFDAQVAFNLLSAYGHDSKISLSKERSEIARAIANYLDGRARVPAIQLVQAPVFYGYAFAAYGEIAAAEPPEQLAAAFANLGVKVSSPEDAAPTNVSVAGESEIQLARIEPDPSGATSVWLWGVADNLRLAATNAVRIAEELLEK